MEVEVIKRFIPDLVTAISDCVQCVSDECLAKGLTTESTYRRVLESGETSEEKARILTLAVKKSTETDSRCLEIFLDILTQQLPYGIRDKLLSEMRKHLSENTNTGRAVVPTVQSTELIPSRELAKETVVQHNALLGKFEEAVRQHAKCCTEKNLLQERLKVKSEECEKMRQEIVLADQRENHTEETITDVKNKLETCNSEMENLRARVKELEKAIEEQDMQVKRGRKTIVMKTSEIFVKVVQQSQEKIKEMETRIREMEREQQQVLLQEKEVRIKELEADLKLKQHEGASSLATQIPEDRLTKRHAGPLFDSIKKVNRSRLLDVWCNTATHLGFSDKEINDIDSINCTLDDRLYLVILQWLEQYPGDSRGSTKFPTHSDLVTALIKAGHGTIAHELIPYKDLSHV